MWHSSGREETTVIYNYYNTPFNNMDTGWPGSSRILGGASSMPPPFHTSMPAENFSTSQRLVYPTRALMTQRAQQNSATLDGKMEPIDIKSASLWELPSEPHKDHIQRLEHSARPLKHVHTPLELQEWARLYSLQSTVYTLEGAQGCTEKLVILRWYSLHEFQRAWRKSKQAFRCMQNLLKLDSCMLFI